MKRIIERQLPLNVRYNLINKTYTALVDSIGCTCANCGKLISNIATVQAEGKTQSFLIGFDCLETILINNNLLDSKSIADYQGYKSSLPTFLKHSKEIKETINETNSKYISKIVSVEFDVKDFLYWSQHGKSSFLSYRYIFDNGKKHNNNIRLKNTVVLEDFINVFKSVNKIPVSIIN